MTREEKISQLVNAAPAIPRLRIPAYEWWNEGLHGLARNGYATVFPQAIGLAATWNTDLLEQVGTVVSTEARAKFNLAGGPGKDHRRYEGLTIWSPNINIFRDPRWGRGQETYGEDPFLTARLAVAFVHGLQGDDPARPRTIAAPKHLAVHSGPEPGRHGFDVDVSPHDLEATYTPAFRAAVIEGRAGSVMCAYNALHGTPACAAESLLNGRLRRDWGFTGFTVSDCDAVSDMAAFHHFRADHAASSAAALKAGLDLNCGSAYLKLGEALERGEVDEALIDQALVRLFAARYRLGELHPQGADPYASLGADDVDNAAHRALALRAAAQSLVLLKNEHGTLPLASGKRIAVIGPNADALAVLEANYQGTSREPVTPLQGLRARFGNERIVYAQGAHLAEGVPTTIPETALRRRRCGRPEGRVFRQHGTARHTESWCGRIAWSASTGTASRRPKDCARTAIRCAGPANCCRPVPATTCWRCAWRAASTAPAMIRCACTSTTNSSIAGDAKANRTTAVTHDTGEKSLETLLHFDDARPRRIRLELEHRGEDQGIRLEWIAPAQSAAGRSGARGAKRRCGGRLRRPVAGRRRRGTADRRARLRRRRPQRHPPARAAAHAARARQGERQTAGGGADERQRGRADLGAAARRRDPRRVVSGPVRRHRDRARAGRRRQSRRPPAGDLLPLHPRPAAVCQLRHAGRTYRYFDRQAAVSVRPWAELHAASPTTRRGCPRAC